MAFYEKVPKGGQCHALSPLFEQIDLNVVKLNSSDIIHLAEELAVVSNPYLNVMFPRTLVG